MTFSGTSENSANNLQHPDTSNDEDHFAGTGTRGSFTLGEIRAISNTPSLSGSCSGCQPSPFCGIRWRRIFRFNDGSLLYVQLKQGDDGIDPAANDAQSVLKFEITGGTGRFRNASGTLALTEKVLPVLTDALNNPLYFAATGRLPERFS
jgi:hypothetical protein